SFAALRELKNMDAYHTAVWLRCFNRSDDYKGTGAMSHALIRIFPNRPEIRYRGMIHEFPTLDNRDVGLDAVVSPVAIDHYGYMKEIVHGRNKGQRNLDIVQAAAEKEPDDPFHWFNLGSTAFLVGDPETARTALEKMIEIAGDRQRGFLPNGLALLSEIYCDKMHDPVRAEQVAEHALRLSPHYANAHFQLGKAFIGQRRFADARRAFEAAIDDGKHAEKQFVVDDEVYIWKAHSELGSSFVMEGNDTEALVWFERGLKNRPNAQPLRINRARALERLGRHDEARDALSELHRLYPDEATTVEYVNFLLRHGFERDALDVVDASIAQLTGEAAVSLLLGATAVAQKLGSESDERYLRLAADRAPGSSLVLGPLQALLEARGRGHEFEPYAERERETPPQSLDDYLRRSHFAMLAGNFSEAASIALAGLERYGDAHQLRYNAASALARSDGQEKALEILAHLHGQDDDAGLRGAQLEIQLLLERGSNDAALRSAKMAVARFPLDVPLAIVSSQLMVRDGRSEEAVALLTGIFDLDRRRVGIELGTLLVSLGRLEEAGRIAEKALS
ncbi:MAG: tetratricopeptide repeat protein, partial [Vulcanimicrobiaceae bacterium]